jgi:hypothetical protein
MRKPLYEQVVRLALAPLNLNAFALVGPLRHALRLRGYICAVPISPPSEAHSLLVRRNERSWRL